MEVKVLVQNVKSVSDQKWCITAKDETGGIMRFGLSKEYGEPHAGDEITLRYPRGIANKVEIGRASCRERVCNAV